MTLLPAVSLAALAFSVYAVESHAVTVAQDTRRIAVQVGESCLMPPSCVLGHLQPETFGRETDMSPSLAKGAFSRLARQKSERIRQESRSALARSLGFPAAKGILR